MCMLFPSFTTVQLTMLGDSILQIKSRAGLMHVYKMFRNEQGYLASKPKFVPSTSFFLVSREALVSPKTLSEQNAHVQPTSAYLKSVSLEDLI